MTEFVALIKQSEDQIEKALWSLEVEGKLEEALEAYRTAESALTALELTADQPAYTEQQRVLAYCLLRQGNVLRQLGQSQEALALSKREIAAAGASGDDIALARSLMSNGTNHILAGYTEKGMEMMDQSKVLFESGDSHDHRQGLGWYWILQADLANAGLIVLKPSMIIDATDRALAILFPIENWTGVARAHAARAQAYENIGDDLAAAADRKSQQQYESMIEKREA